MKCPHCSKTIPRKVIVAESGRIGGKITARRGPEYFRQLQAMRKTRAGGRSRKMAKIYNTLFVANTVDHPHAREEWEAKIKALKQGDRPVSFK
jgi:5'(3')-deoxyribonucleotidase